MRLVSFKKIEFRLNQLVSRENMHVAGAAVNPDFVSLVESWQLAFASGEILPCTIIRTSDGCVCVQESVSEVVQKLA